MKRKDAMQRKRNNFTSTIRLHICGEYGQYENDMTRNFPMSFNVPTHLPFHTILQPAPNYVTIAIIFQVVVSDGEAGVGGMIDLLESLRMTLIFVIN